MNESKGVFSSLYRRGGTNLFVLNKQKSLEIKALFYKAISINYYDHEKDKRSHVSINNLVMIDSEIPSSLFCLRGSRTNRTLVRAMGKQKLREAIFSVRSSRRFFRGHFCGPKKQ